MPWGRDGTLTFLKVMVASTSSPAKTASSLNVTKTRTWVWFEGEEARAGAGVVIVVERTGCRGCAESPKEGWLFDHVAEGISRWSEEQKKNAARVWRCSSQGISRRS